MTNIAGRFPRITHVSLMTLLFCSMALVACAERKRDCPPHTGTNDEAASGLRAEDKVEFEIPETHPITFSGVSVMFGPQSIPRKGDFTVSGGTLISKLGYLKKQATFGAWDYIYSDSSKSKIIGWGPCLTSGEVLVSDLCSGHASADRYAENFFEAQDFGQYHTLIRVDPSRGHKLCLHLGPEVTGGEYSLTLEEINAGDILNITYSASYRGRISEDDLSVRYPGTIVQFRDIRLIRKTDGWYEKP